MSELQATVEVLKRVEAEHHVGAVIGDPLPLPEIPGCPPGVRETFSLFASVEGTFFRFCVPDLILSVEAWNNRPALDFLPVEDPIPIGSELWNSQRITRGRGPVVEGETITMDSVDGDVYYLSDDDWMVMHETLDGDYTIHEIAPDVPTFFAEYVFGPRYPDLVRLVLGPGAFEHRIRTGRHKGQPTDSWLRLLQAAGIVPR